jgi:RNA polymerase sigma factor (sigma-70 family)
MRGMRSDRELVRALRALEPGAFEELYRLHRDRIWRFLVRLSGSASLAEDLFQETWLAAARHAHVLHEDTAPLRWLYTIARNKHRNARRSFAMESRRRAALHVAPRDEAPRPDEAAVSRVEAERVRAALTRLPEAHREVLVLCACEGLDSAGAADVLDLKPEAVRKRLSRARAELAALVGREAAEKGEMR